LPRTRKLTSSPGFLFLGGSHETSASYLSLTSRNRVVDLRSQSTRSPTEVFPCFRFTTTPLSTNCLPAAINACLANG